MTDDTWGLNNIAVVFIAAPAEKVWAALVGEDPVARPFMGQPVEVGEVGGRYAVGEGVTGEVLAKDRPHRLRVTWVVPAPPGVALPNCEVEYLIEPAETPQGGEVVKLTVYEFTDGPVPPQFKRAGAIGWGLITSNLKTWLETGQALPAVKLQPPG
ncbi:MAG TPA: SRPBCC domain-containing protein [Phenylobacterium sp.]|nr:SRPBCC domain-containing protein [Phenylobacterium sp.]